jgi:hypothetical protein
LAMGGVGYGRVVAVRISATGRGNATASVRLLELPLAEKVCTLVTLFAALAVAATGD